MLLGTGSCKIASYHKIGKLQSRSKENDPLPFPSLPSQLGPWIQDFQFFPFHSNFPGKGDARAQKDSASRGLGEETSIESVLGSSTYLSSIEEAVRSLPAPGGSSGFAFPRTARASGGSVGVFLAVPRLGLWQDPPRWN